METSQQLGEYACFVDRSRTLRDELGDIDLKPCMDEKESL